MSPKFSIIIPVYNVAPYLRECLDSVLAQTFTDWEAICVDDGSTDGSGRILDEYSFKDSRISKIHQKNEGVSSARNRALANCRGDWVVFLDPDDYVKKDWLKFIASSIENKANSDLIVTRAYEDYFQAEKSFVLRRWGECVQTDSPSICRGWQFVSQVSMPWCYSIRRECIRGRKFPIGVRMREDALFELGIFQDVDSIGYVDESQYVYRRMPQAASLNLHTDDSLNFLSRLLDIYNSQKLLVPVEFHKILQSSFTYLSMKDVTVWHRNCNNIKFRDDLSVCKILRKSLKDGAFCLKMINFSMRIRWWLYLRTGYYRFINVNFHLCWFRKLTKLIIH